MEFLACGKDNVYSIANVYEVKNKGMFRNNYNLRYSKILYGIQK